MGLIEYLEVYSRDGSALVSVKVVSDGVDVWVRC